MPSQQKKPTFFDGLRGKSALGRGPKPRNDSLDFEDDGPEEVTQIPKTRSGQQKPGSRADVKNSSAVRNKPDHSQDFKLEPRLVPCESCARKIALNLGIICADRFKVHPETGETCGKPMHNCAACTKSKAECHQPPEGIRQQVIRLGAMSVQYRGDEDALEDDREFLAEWEALSVRVLKGLGYNPAPNKPDLKDQIVDLEAQIKEANNDWMQLSEKNEELLFELSDLKDKIYWERTDNGRLLAGIQELQARSEELTADLKKSNSLLNGILRHSGGVPQRHTHSVAPLMDRDPNTESRDQSDEADWGTTANSVSDMDAGEVGDITGSQKEGSDEDESMQGSPVSRRGALASGEIIVIPDDDTDSGLSNE
ncbi:hypothetical protein NW762_012879 [Fusarium torreyae]|uniref:Uncharacterized protein n=1 Tax=Fusarium torreyae TaxID=1237075 RepID=A0A9W8VAX9_9HYPO|nr:hypothetical protein NW762_012879 [Fusarium torreyae]